MGADAPMSLALGAAGMPLPSPLVAIGVSHHTAPVAVRERLALDPDAVMTEIDALRRAGLAREALVVSTCNRVELYAVPGEAGPGPLAERWSRRRVAARETAERYLYMHRDTAAVRHLFRVASALDSLVLGEPQILGQVKTAVRLAGDAGALGAVLNRLTQRTFWVAKQVRTRTELGRATVGVGNAGVKLAESIFTSLDGRRAMLVGTGEMGRQVAAAMVHAGVGELVVANRTFDRAVALAEGFGGTPIHLDRVSEYLARVDIVIVATAAARPVIEAADVAEALRVRRYAPLFLVDLSVPRNIDPAVDRLERAFVFNVDDLRQVTERGMAAREEASTQAEAFVAREADRFARRLGDLRVNERIGAVVRTVEALRIEELARSERVLAELTDAQRAGIDAMTRALAKKVLHRPLAQLRAALRAGDVSAAEAILAAWDAPADDAP